MILNYPSYGTFIGIITNYKLLDGNISPFDSWQRTKGGEAGTSKKRAGSPMRGGIKKARA